MKKLIVLLLVLCSCSQKILTSEQTKYKENKKFARNNITQTKAWPIWSIALFILVAPNVDKIEERMRK